MTDINDWSIDTNVLKGYGKSDCLSETPDGKYAVFFYNADEWSMNRYGARFALYNDKNSYTPILNSGVTWIYFDDERTFAYAPLSDCLIFKKPAYWVGLDGKDFPFLLIKPSQKQFAFLEWDGTSVYYGFNEMEKDKLILKEVMNMDHLNVRKRTNEIIDISKLTWYDFKDFDIAFDFYQVQAKNAAKQTSGGSLWKKLFGI